MTTMSRWQNFTVKGKSPVVQELFTETNEHEPEVVCPTIVYPCPINHEQSDHKTCGCALER